MALADYTASTYDIRLQRGDDLVEQFTFTDDDGEALDLSGYTFASQLRQTADGTLLATFTVSVSDNVVSRTLSRTVTATLDGTYVHDLQWTDPSGRVRTLLSGEVEVVEDVTR